MLMTSAHAIVTRRDPFCMCMLLDSPVDLGFGGVHYRCYIYEAMHHISIHRRSAPCVLYSMQSEESASSTAHLYPTRLDVPWCISLVYLTAWKSVSDKHDHQRRALGLRWHVATSLRPSYHIDASLGAQSSTMRSRPHRRSTRYPLRRSLNKISKCDHRQLRKGWASQSLDTETLAYQFVTPSSRNSCSPFQKPSITQDFAR